MRSNADVQSCLIAYLKAQPSLILYQEEIREENWQGNTVEYPNIRVSLGTQQPVANCDLGTLTFKIQCSSNQSSSQEADVIAGLVTDALNNKSFTMTDASGVTVRFTGCRSTGMDSARRVDEFRWLAISNFRVMVN